MGTLITSGTQNTQSCDCPTSFWTVEYLPLTNLIVRGASDHKNILVLSEVFISALNLYKLLHLSTQDTDFCNHPSSLNSSLSYFSFFSSVDLLLKH